MNKMKIISYIMNGIIMLFIFAALAIIMSIYAQAAPGPSSGDRPTWPPPDEYAGEPDFDFNEFPMKPRDVVIHCARLLKRDKNIFIRYASMTIEYRGCSSPCINGRWNRGKCFIIYINRPAYSTTPEAVREHELGHLKGWRHP